MVDYGISKMHGNKPDLYDDLGRNLWDLGVSFIEDDKGDIGYTTYSNRFSHVYHGEVRPDHPSPFHHWQAGIGLCMLGQFCGMLGTFNEFMRAMKTEEDNGNGSNTLAIAQRRPLITP